MAASLGHRRQAGGPRAGAIAAWSVAIVAILSATPLAQVRATYLYSLSNFTGPLHDDFVRLAVDRDRDEIYVIYQNLIRVFNASGMEVFSFGDDLDLGQIVDLAVDASGDLILLSYREARPLVTRCTFRGVPAGSLEISGLPASLAFRPNRMIYRNGLLYFLSTTAASLILTDAGGAFRDHLDLAAIVGHDEWRTGGGEIGGFSVDDQGNVYFTVPVLFRVYRLAPDRTVTFFGRSGSAPGRFGVVAGVATDSHGHILVADRLKCVVMVFDTDFTFLAEFGYRGTRPENLIVPDQIAIDSRDRVYVTQGRRRGVSVFALTH
jgi:hypothetical protein